MIETKRFTSATNLPESWDPLVSHDIFLQTAYLQGLELAAPKNISNYYIGFYKENTLVGVVVIQRVQLYLDDIFRNHNDSCFKERFKHVVSKLLKGNILVVGNMTHTGQHAVYFNTNTIPISVFLNVLLEEIDNLKQDIKHHFKKPIRAVLFKDYFLDDTIHAFKNDFLKHSFYQVKVQPNMIFPIWKQWHDFNDYLNSLHKKYRDRYKSARRKANGLVKKELDTESILKNSESLYKLYKNVSDNAKINTFILPENHFSVFKMKLGDSFKVFGYYLDKELIGFYSLIINNKELETYFLGYKTDYNHKHQLYLNMLYDMAEFGINNHFSSIIYARTAMEIKSSVGAKETTMLMYLKHTNWLLNTFLKYIFKLMNPSKKWQERHPFKSN